MNDPHRLLPLLDHLAAATPARASAWQDWAIQPVGGAGNNRLYRATGPAGDFAVKFTIRDARDRAGREYEALCLLQALGVGLAATPVLLERDRYAHPVVVQTWLDGRVSAVPPATDAEWQALLAHFAAIHQITLAQPPTTLRPAVLNMTSAAQGLERIREQVARLPPAAQPASLIALVRRVAATRFPTWPPPTLTLCRCDPNILNFVRGAGTWRSVDWENSGWGDPAFEIGDLLAHPAYAVVSDPRRAWISNRYAVLCGDATVIPRIRLYYLLTLVWWVARLARSRYEIPAGRDERLAPRPTGWQEDLEGKYNHYVQRATEALDQTYRT